MDTRKTRFPVASLTSRTKLPIVVSSNFQAVDALSFMAELPNEKFCQYPQVADFWGGVKLRQRRSEPVAYGETRISWRIWEGE